MPLYEFACTACNHAFDELLPASRRDEPQVCPECGAPAQRQVSMFATSRKSSGGASSSSGKSCSSCSSHNCGSCS